MELRRARWLEKLALMNETRGPRKILVSWIQEPRKQGGQRKTIRSGYADTIEDNLGFEDSKLSTLMEAASHHWWNMEWLIKVVISQSQTRYLLALANHKVGTFGCQRCHIR